MDKNKTKYLIILAIFALTLLTTMLCSCNVSPSQQTLARECVRIHIRANSNSQEDQTVKLKVRDAITAYLQDKLSACKTKQDAVSTLQAEQQNLINIANQTLYNNNFNYKTSIRLKNEYFPDRNYDGYDFPAGYYDALIIYLGEGIGDNWWCVAFPPLCFVPNGNGEEKIEYKSWIKEWLDRLFSK